MTVRPALVFALALALFSPAALAQETDGDEPPRDRRLGLVLGYGAATEINGSTEIDIGSLALRWTRALDDFRPLDGDSRWGWEGVVFGFDQEPTAIGLGGHLLYELRLAPAAAVGPVVRVGLGALVSNGRVPPGETWHNFSLFAEGGLQIELSEPARLEIGYRFHHVSNADTGVRNLGINAHTLVLALSWQR